MYYVYMHTRIKACDEIYIYIHIRLLETFPIKLDLEIALVPCREGTMEWSSLCYVTQLEKIWKKFRQTPSDLQTINLLKQGNTVRSSSYVRQRLSLELGIFEKMVWTPTPWSQIKSEEPCSKQSRWLGRCPCLSGSLRWEPPEIAELICRFVEMKSKCSFWIGTDLVVMKLSCFSCSFSWRLEFLSVLPIQQVIL